MQDVQKFWNKPTACIYCGRKKHLNEEKFKAEWQNILFKFKSLLLSKVLYRIRLASETI